MENFEVLDLVLETQESVEVYLSAPLALTFTQELLSTSIQLIASVAAEVQINSETL